MAKSTDEPAPDPKAIYADMARLALGTLIECVAMRPPSLLVTQEGAPAALGLSRRAFFRLKSRGALPAPVDLGDGELMYRRADLQAWVAKLRTLKS